MTDPRPPDLPDTAGVERVLGSRIVASRPLPWGFAHRTDLVETDRGDRAAITWLVPATAAVRVALEEQIRVAAAGSSVPVAELLGSEVKGDHPFLATRFVHGESGAAALDDPADAAALGRAMGGLLGAIRDLSPLVGSRATSPVGGPAVAAASLAPLLSPRGRAVLGRLLESDASRPQRPPVCSHGDWVPVNVLFRDDAVACVLDWEHAGLRDPLFDPAWWRAIVLVHHPGIWRPAWDAFRQAAGLAGVTDDVLTLLPLERFAWYHAHAPDDAARARWRERLEVLLAHAGPG